MIDYTAVNGVSRPQKQRLVCLTIDYTAGNTPYNNDLCVLLPTSLQEIPPTIDDTAGNTSSPTNNVLCILLPTTLQEIPPTTMSCVSYYWLHCRKYPLQQWLVCPTTNYTAVNTPYNRLYCRKYLQPYKQCLVYPSSDYTAGNTPYNNVLCVLLLTTLQDIAPTTMTWVSYYQLHCRKYPLQHWLVNATTDYTAGNTPYNNDLCILIPTTLQEITP